MYSWAPDQRTGNRLVDGVFQHRFGLFARARLLADEPVERLLGIEHQRPQLAVGRPFRHALDPVRFVGRSAVVEAERIGEAAGRVDGDDDGLAAKARAAATPSAAAVVVLPTPPGSAREDQLRRADHFASSDAIGGAASPCVGPDSSSTP